LNFKLTLQYDGTEFHGWQMQGELRTVQGELTRALSLIEGQAVVVHGSGRTDAGVHAEGQVASVKLQREITRKKLCAAINGNVAADLRVLQAEVVSDEFHARYSARSKTYCYRVVNSPMISPFWVRWALHEARPLDLERMQRCSRLFLGEHDWTAFSAAQADVESRVREITRCDVSERFDARAQARLIELTVTANGFLRYMVRSLAGCLLAAGRGETDEATIRRLLADRDRGGAAATAPAHGLTLIRVDYL